MFGSPVFPCKFAATEEAVVVDLRDLWLKPSHCSFQSAVGPCIENGGDFDFECSVDGQTWDALEEVRNDPDPLLSDDGSM